MISVVIPTYETKCVALAREMSRELDAYGLEGEVIVLDDCSPHWEMNAEVDEIEHCRLVRNDRNYGIAANRNRLMDLASGDYLLFLDADVFPVEDDFVKRYYDARGNGDVLIGGLRYREIENKLRYTYGKAVEETASHSMSHFITSNFFIKSEICKKVRFNEEFKAYGHEDTYFGIELRSAGYKVVVINNPAYHDNTDTAEEYLGKVRTSIDMLYVHREKLKVCPSPLLKVMPLMRVMGWMVRPLFRLFRGRMEKNLLGERPSMMVLNAYKLGYLSYAVRLGK